MGEDAGEAEGKAEVEAEINVMKVIKTVVMGVVKGAKAVDVVEAEAGKGEVMERNMKRNDKGLA